MTISMFYLSPSRVNFRGVDVSSVLARREADELTPTSLVAVINSALVFRIDAEHAKVASVAIRKMRYNIDLGAEVASPYALLNGLAVVAAVTRSPELATDVRILARALRGKPNSKIDVAAETRLALIASAAEFKLPEWCKAVGDWITEIAFEDIDRDAAWALATRLRTLCQIVPQLWGTCAKADAALAAIHAK